MEKLMILSECSGLQSREVKDSQGNPMVVESFEVRLADGVDQILAETSKSVTLQLKKEPAIIGQLYAVSVRLNVVDYEKDGKKSRFFKASVMDMKRLDSLVPSK